MAKIVWDAGHGGNGSTPGRRTPDGEYEWNFSDKIVRAGMSFLNGYENAQQLRVDDATGKTNVSLSSRTNQANSFNADVFVSVHQNAFTGSWGTHSGTETYVMTPASNNPKSKALADKVHPKLVLAMGLNDRGIKAENFHVLRETKMPAILAECGFMDSTIDVKRMRSEAVLKSVGEAIAKGVAEYLGLKPKNEGVDTYTVQRGDTLSSIARRFNTTVDALVSLNELSEPNLIYVGQTLKVSYTYTVQRGDTLSSIARRFNTTVDALVSLNGLSDPNLIYIGQTLKISGSVPTPPKEYVQLPGSAATWRTYKLDVQPIKKNSDWSLTPSAFGGLEYEILGKPYPDVVTINTSRGKRNIYVAASTGAKIIKK
ncbi:N-acetylmuramoyl-L-alanine amidase family protein [Jeotgalibacillus marinus]|uniref:LysM peptidoglycan-binding domain-containing protein n=1 Tax=Jeotgalibacillus marinus TaxID=86667 RepID=A0ABV3Q330_9BACL